VTLAALHGTGGSVVGPQVAERLGVEFLDRAISSRIAERAGVPEHAVAAMYDSPQRGMDRVVSRLARVTNASTATGVPVERIDLEDRRLRAELEEFLVRASRDGGVVLGRGGAVVLADVPGALHVYLGGPREGRIEQGGAAPGRNQVPPVARADPPQASAAAILDPGSPTSKALDTVEAWVRQASCLRLHRLAAGVDRRIVPRTKQRKQYLRRLDRGSGGYDGADPGPSPSWVGR
jgi:hypothetical protein